MKQLLEKYLSTVAKHKLKSIYIQDNEITFEYNKLRSFFSRKFIILKDRKSGRRIQKRVRNNHVTLPLSEITEITNSGIINLYLKTSLLGSYSKKSTPFTSNLKLLDTIDKINKAKIKVIKTKRKQNIALDINPVSFLHEIKEIAYENSEFKISGIFEDLHSKGPITAEIVCKRRDTKVEYSFDLDLQKVNKTTYSINGYIRPSSLGDDLIVNSRWDLFLQLRNKHNNLLYNSIINLQSFKNFAREEERYIVTGEESEYVTTLYATMGLNSLALWFTDKTQFQKTYTIAKGKSIFNEISNNDVIHERMVFFESFFGKSYSGNPKYLYEELLRDERFANFKFVWSYSGDSPQSIPGKPILVNRASDDYYKYLAKSKYWVSNIVFPVHKKRDGNIYIQTWHGTPLKKLGFDIDIEGPETLARENFYVESRNWDYLISANSYSSEIFRRAFKFKKELLEVGYPANDIFYRDDLQSYTHELKKKLNIPSDKKVILYAPTWRDNEMVQSWEHSFNLKFDLDTFYKTLKDEYILILRMHHLVSDALNIEDEYKSFVYDLSKYDDIQELYTISDILITDYSSVFFDFANSRKPILFFAYDYQEYKDKIRGFYFDMEEVLPGPVIQQEKQLLEAILNIEEVKEKYQTRYDEFYEKFCGLEEGNAAKKVIERVFK